MSAVASPPAAFDLSGLHRHILARLPVLLSQDADERKHQEALLRKRLPHVFAGDEVYQVKAPPAGATLASMIDHTILKADATGADVRKVCAEAVQHRFASVCVNSSRVAECVAYFRAHVTAQSYSPRVCFVTGFPLGASTTIAKVSETMECFDRHLADEVDMVLNIGWLKDGDFEGVKRDIEGVVRASDGLNQKRGLQTIVKVILETCLLTNEEIIDATLLCVLAGANFVKTCQSTGKDIWTAAGGAGACCSARVTSIRLAPHASSLSSAPLSSPLLSCVLPAATGFSTGGAVAHQVRLMKSIVGDALEVKASGGIRDAAQAKAMVESGATRLGCSAGVAICGGSNAATPAGDGKY